MRCVVVLVCLASLLTRPCVGEIVYDYSYFEPDPYLELYVARHPINIQSKVISVSWDSVDHSQFETWSQQVNEYGAEWRLRIFTSNHIFLEALRGRIGDPAFAVDVAVEPVLEKLNTLANMELWVGAFHAGHFASPSITAVEISKLGALVPLFDATVDVVAIRNHLALNTFEKGTFDAMTFGKYSKVGNEEDKEKKFQPQDVEFVKRWLSGNIEIMRPTPITTTTTSTAASPPDPNLYVKYLVYFTSTPTAFTCQPLGNLDAIASDLSPTLSPFRGTPVSTAKIILPEYFAAKKKDTTNLRSPIVPSIAWITAAASIDFCQFTNNLDTLLLNYALRYTPALYEAIKTANQRMPIASNSLIPQDLMHTFLRMLFPTKSSTLMQLIPSVATTFDDIERLSKDTTVAIPIFEEFVDFEKMFTNTVGYDGDMAIAFETSLEAFKNPESSSPGSPQFPPDHIRSFVKGCASCTSLELLSLTCDTMHARTVYMLLTTCQSKSPFEKKLFMQQSLLTKQINTPASPKTTNCFLHKFTSRFFDDAKPMSLWDKADLVLEPCDPYKLESSVKNSTLVLSDLARNYLSLLDAGWFSREPDKANMNIFSKASVALDMLKAKFRKTQSLTSAQRKVFEEDPQKQQQQQQQHVGQVHVDGKSSLAGNLAEFLAGFGEEEQKAIVDQLVREAIRIETTTVTTPPPPPTTTTTKTTTTTTIAATPGSHNEAGETYSPVHADSLANDDTYSSNNSNNNSNNSLSSDFASPSENDDVQVASRDENDNNDNNESNNNNDNNDEISW